MHLTDGVCVCACVCDVQCHQIAFLLLKYFLFRVNHSVTCWPIPGLFACLLSFTVPLTKHVSVCSCWYLCLSYLSLFEGFRDVKSLAFHALWGLLWLCCLQMTVSAVLLFNEPVLFSKTVTHYSASKCHTVKVTFYFSKHMNSLLLNFMALSVCVFCFLFIYFFPLITLLIQIQMNEWMNEFPSHRQFWGCV